MSSGSSIPCAKVIWPRSARGDELEASLAGRMGAPRQKDVKGSKIHVIIVTDACLQRVVAAGFAGRGR